MRECPKDIGLGQNYTYEIHINPDVRSGYSLWFTMVVELAMTSHAQAN